MNRLPSPIARDAAADLGAAVDGDELAEDVPPADDQPGRLAVVFEVLRRQSDRGHREDLGLVADLGDAVDRRPTRRSGSRVADPHVRADDAVWPDRGAAADARAAGARSPTGWMLAAPGSTASSSRASATTLIADVGAACATASGDRAAPERHLEPQDVARDHAAAEAAVVHAAQRHAGRGARAFRARAGARWRPASAPRPSGPPASAAGRESDPGRTPHRP